MKKLHYSSGLHSYIVVGRLLRDPNWKYCHFFPSKSLTYVHKLINPNMTNVTHHGCALTSEQILCLLLQFHANYRFLLSSISDAEHISETRVCRPIRDIIFYSHFTNEGTIITTQSSQKTPTNYSNFIWSFFPTNTCPCIRIK